MPVQPGGHVYREIGAGTTQDPKIMWLVHPPSKKKRLAGNEKVARELGNIGMTNIWVRSCDHKTTRISVVANNGDRTRQTVRSDDHITVYCTKGSTADLQGDVFLVIENNGVWRIMLDSERTTPNGKGVELDEFPKDNATNQSNVSGLLEGGD